MKGVVFLGERECVVKELPRPEPGAGQVLVRMRAAGICGSDLHVYRGLTKERAREVGDRVPGHEPSGIVAAVGEGTRKVRLGDRVSVYHYLGCGACGYCAAGVMQWCRQARGYGGPVDGAHADFVLTDERNCVPLPEPLTFGDGAFIACAGGTAFSALKKLAPAQGEALAVFGLGPVGASGVLLGRAMGARVIGIDPVPERRALASRLGAEAVIDGGTTDVAVALRDLTGGEGVALAIEASGSADGRRALVAALRRAGRAIFLGVGSDEPTLNLTEIINRQLTLMGSFVLPLGMAWELVQFLLAHSLSFDPAITHRFPIEQAPEAYRVAGEGACGKVILAWE